VLVVKLSVIAVQFAHSPAVSAVRLGGEVNVTWYTPGIESAAIISLGTISR